MELRDVAGPCGMRFTLKAPEHYHDRITLSCRESVRNAIFAASCGWADVVVDIGAYVGYDTLIAATMNVNGRVIAVEPHEENVQVLLKNLSANGCERVEVHMAAMAEEARTVTLLVPEVSDKTAVSDLVETTKAQVMAICGADLHIRPGGALLVKIAAEGHELKVLRGLERVIAEAAVTRMLVEFHPEQIFAVGGSPLELLDWLRAADFRIFALNESARRWSEVHPGQTPTGVAGSQAHVNLWCLPRGATLTVSAVLHSAALGGAELSHVERVKELVADGCLVHSILPLPDQGLGDLLRMAGSAVAFVDTYPWWVAMVESGKGHETIDIGWNALASRQVTTEIALVDADLVLTQTIVITQGAIAAAALGKPHVWCLHELADIDLRLPFPPEKVGRIVASMSALTITASRTVRDRFFPAPTDDVIVRYEPPMLAIVPERDSDVARPWTIGVVGALISGKGQEDAIRAVALLAERNVDVTLHLVGGGPVSEITRLRELCKHLDVSERVEILGRREGLAEIYGGLDALAITSRSEGFGRVLFEAADAGLPVIVTRIPALLEFVQPGVTGLVYDAEDVVALADGIEALATDSALAHELVAEARASLGKVRENCRVGSPFSHELSSALGKTKAVVPRETTMWLAAGLDGQSTQQ